MTTQTKKTKKEDEAVSLLEQFKNSSKTLDTIKEYEKSGNRAGAFERLKEGETVVRFLPGLDDGPFYRRIKFHWLNNEFIYCRKDLGMDEECPVCQHGSFLWNKFQETNEERYKEQAKDFFAKEKYLYNVVIRGSGDTPDRVVVLETGVGVKKSLLDLLEDEDVQDFTDPIEGRDMKINREGSGMGTKYTVKYKPNKSLVAGSVDDPKNAAVAIKAVLDQRKELENLITYPSFEKVDEKMKRYRSVMEGKATSDSNESSSEEDSDKEDVLARLERDLAKNKPD